MPTQDQLLNAAIMLDAGHPQVAAMLVRMAAACELVDLQMQLIVANSPAPDQQSEKPGQAECKSCKGMGFVDGVGESCLSCSGQGVSLQPQAVEPSFHIKADALAQMAPPMLLLHGVTLYGYGAADTVPVYANSAPTKPQAVHPEVAIALQNYINAAGINGGDSPYIVVEKLQRAIDATKNTTERKS